MNSVSTAIVPAPLSFDVHALPGARDPRLLFEHTLKAWNSIDDV